uniref:Uncharacterized protein n=1 Tax=Glossina pallidipes TaxID=7398 RepID=A0A1A9Z1W7_GLOPL
MLKKRVLDEAARQRLVRKAVEALEQDNFHEDPHADLLLEEEKQLNPDPPNYSSALAPPPKTMHHLRRMSKEYNLLNYSVGSAVEAEAVTAAAGAAVV